MKYKLIYADPPWQYRDKQEFKKFRPHGIGAEFHYPTMPLKDIKTMEIPNDDNCVLFLWVTVPLLQEGLEVLKEWGFNYKTTIFWRKRNYLGLGYWFRGQVEMCLLGIRGDVKAFRCQKTNFIDAIPRKHSQKPSEMYSLIESLDINPKIELFARHKREGWDVWGNETPNDTQKILKPS